jgi:hypothetical protein
MKRPKPIFKKGHWICPKCGWRNPMPAKAILTYPPVTCHRCLGGCGYEYDKMGHIDPAHEFGMKYPGGRLGGLT